MEEFLFFFSLHSLLIRQQKSLEYTRGGIGPTRGKENPAEDSVVANGLKKKSKLRVVVIAAALVYFVFHCYTLIVSI